MHLSIHDNEFNDKNIMLKLSTALKSNEITSLFFDYATYRTNQDKVRPKYDLAKLFSENRSLIEITFKDAYFDQPLHCLLMALKNHSNLMHLTIRNYDALSKRTYKALECIIKEMPQLKNLSFWYLPFQNRDLFSILCNALKSNKTIEKIHFWDVKFSNDTLQILKDTLAVNARIKIYYKHELIPFNELDSILMRCDSPQYLINDRSSSTSLFELILKNSVACNALLTYLAVLATTLMLARQNNLSFEATLGFCATSALVASTFSFFGLTTNKSFLETKPLCIENNRI